VAAYLDRVNVSFAKLTMAVDLNFSDTVYGFGAGVFFFGYFLFEVPSNLLMHRIGARLTLARIMILWGLISAAMMFVTTPTQFYVMRFFLGAAEAGFFPGVVLYLTYWYPAARRGRALALFVTAVAIAGVVGNPVSGWIMGSTHGSHGLAGWQWLFLLEGLPSVALGLFALYWLDNGVQDARWLSPEERALIAANIVADGAHKTATSALAGLRDRRVWLLSAIYFFLVSGLYGINFWLPTIIKGLGVTDLRQLGLVSAIPWLAAVCCMPPTRPPTLSASVRVRSMIASSSASVGGCPASVLKQHEAPKRSICIISDASSSSSAADVSSSAAAPPSPPPRASLDSRLTILSR
jgi:MFS family permease